MIEIYFTEALTRTYTLVLLAREPQRANAISHVCQHIVTALCLMGDPFNSSISPRGGFNEDVLLLLRAHSNVAFFYTSVHARCGA